jgi:hypothetical protein
MMEVGALGAGAIAKEVTNNELLERIHAMHRTVAHIGNLSDSKPFNPGLFLDEWVDTGPTISVLTTTMKLGISSPALVESLIWSIPDSTGTLQIGSRYIPLNASSGSLLGMTMIVYPEDKFTLTTKTTAGQLYLEIMGKVFEESARWNRV